MVDITPGAPDAQPSTHAAEAHVHPAGVDWALYAASHGWRVFPLLPSTRAPYANHAIAAALSIPTPEAGRGGPYLATTDEASIRAMWAGNRAGALVGLAMGGDRMAVDRDEKNGKSGGATMEANGWTVPATATQRTRSGGEHYVLSVPTGTPAPNDTDYGSGVDRRGDGGFIVLSQGTLLAAPLAPAPAWALAGGCATGGGARAFGPGEGERAPSYAEALDALRACDASADRAKWLVVSGAFHAATAGLVDDMRAQIDWQAWCARHAGENDPAANARAWAGFARGGTSGDWHTLASVGGRPDAVLAARLFGGEPVAVPAGRTFDDMLTDAAKLLPDDADRITGLCREAAGLSEVHREALLKAIHTTTGVRLASLRREATPQREAEPDHLALARTTLQRIGRDNILFADGRFWLWSGVGVWKRRDDIAVKQHVQGTIEQGGHAVTAAKVASVTDVARSEAYSPDHRWNTGLPDVVNCTNGELELSNGRWTRHPHRKGDYRTAQIPVAYDPAATAPLFWQFIYDVFRDDSDRDAKVRATLELIGYTLMAHARHETFIMLLGNGANGKSVLLKVIEALVGRENVAAVAPSKFDNVFQRAHLNGKLANIVTELRQGEVIADAELKAITSGELTTVEEKHQTPFDMRAFSTCWFGTNHLPHTRDFSDALFRRAMILTFNRTFAAGEQDRTLSDKLSAELPGILNMALTCYADALAHGFTVPPSSDAAKARWRMEADQVARFVAECCAPDPHGWVDVGTLYTRFDLWARQSGVRQILGKQAMGDRLERQGFTRDRSGGSIIRGLKITGAIV